MQHFSLGGNQIGAAAVVRREAEASMDKDWMAKGHCADKPPALFFPSDGVGVEIARRICKSCPEQEPCLEYALRNRIDHGVWGGTSERERRRILKRRRVEAAASGNAAYTAEDDLAEIDEVGEASGAAIRR
ncbi:MAG: WhiB family transcriptional regulator [Acidimicrobiales bacterium]